MKKLNNSLASFGDMTSDFEKLSKKVIPSKKAIALGLIVYFLGILSIIAFIGFVIWMIFSNL